MSSYFVFWLLFDLFLWSLFISGIFLLSIFLSPLFLFSFCYTSLPFHSLRLPFGSRSAETLSAFCCFCNPFGAFGLWRGFGAAHKVGSPA